MFIHQKHSNGFETHHMCIRCRLISCFAQNTALLIVSLLAIEILEMAAGDVDLSDAPPFDQYIAAVYFAMTSIATVG